jgi:hypothetical protein
MSAVPKQTPRNVAFAFADIRQFLNFFDLWTSDAAKV